MALDPVIVRDLMGALKSSIMNKKVDTTSALSVVMRGMEIIDTYKNLNGQQKKDYVFAVVKELAKGTDGIAGTKDDLLPQSTVDALATIIRENLLGSFINIVSDAAKGKLDVNRVVSTTVSCFKLCFK